MGFGSAALEETIFQPSELCGCSPTTSLGPGAVAFTKYTDLWQNVTAVTVVPAASRNFAARGRITH